MEKKQFLILFLVLWSQQSSCILDDIWSAVTLIRKVVLVFNDIMTAEAGITTIYGVIADEHDSSVAITTPLNQLLINVHDFTMYTSQKLNRIEEKINGISHETKIDRQLGKISEFIREIDDYWNEFVAYQKKNVTGEPVNRLTSNILSTTENKLSHFRNAILSRSSIALLDDGLFTLIPNLAQEKKEIECGKGHTFHDTLVSLFRAAMITEVRTYLLQSFSQRYQFDKNDGTFLFSSSRQKDMSLLRTGDAIPSQFRSAEIHA